MPSFTSSFDRADHGRNLLVLGIAALVFFGQLLLAETVFRQNGITANYNIDNRRWVSDRHSASGADGIATVLVGGSRMQWGFSVGAFNRAFPGATLYQLAIAGGHGYATFEDLAKDESFRGNVIFDLTAETLLPENYGSQKNLVALAKRGLSLDRQVNFYIEDALAPFLFVRQKRLGFQRFWIKNILLDGSLPDTLRYLEQRQTGEVLAHYDRLTATKKQRRGRINLRKQALDRYRLITATAWLNGLDDFENLVRKLHARGGKLAIVRFPTVDEHWDIDQSLFPKAQFWDILAARTDAITVHFQDSTCLSGYNLPDTSHLDASDRGAFTKCLLDILNADGMQFTNGP